MMKYVAKISVLLFCTTANSAAVGIVETLVYLIPAMASAKGTYDMLGDTNEIYDMVGYTDKNFSVAVQRFEKEFLKPLFKATEFREFQKIIVRFNKIFKSHEKIALIGTASAILTGGMLMSVGAMQMLFYGVMRRNHEYSRESCENGFKRFAIGSLSLATGLGMASLLRSKVVSDLD